MNKELKEIIGDKIKSINYYWSYAGCQRKSMTLKDNYNYCITSNEPIEKLANQIKRVIVG